MKVAIMQPYLFPYIGYFKLINAVDKFILYDNVEYTKKGWINRNRLLFNKKISTFGVPIKKSSDYINIKEKLISNNQNGERHIEKTLRLIEINYNKSKYFNEAYEIVNNCFRYKSLNLFDFIHNAITKILEYLEIKTNVIISSDLNIDNELSKENKVISICKSLNSTTYINAIGGFEIYNSNRFKNENINLRFLKSTDYVYHQGRKRFHVNLSIIDTMMHVNKYEIINELNNYNLIENH